MEKSQSAILIPVYKPFTDDDEMTSFLNALNRLAANDIYIICPSSLTCYASNLASRQKASIAVVTFSKRYFKSIRGYNRLMLSRQLYAAFVRYKYILVAQLDTLIFGDSQQLEAFERLDYSYIGAPWVSHPQNNQQSLHFHGVGNGGLSLRKISDMLNLITAYERFQLGGMCIAEIKASSKSWPIMLIKMLILKLGLATRIPIMNEDKFICNVLAKASSDFKIAPFSIARAFAFESCPSALYLLNKKKMPFGCHAWRKNEPDFWSSMLAVTISIEKKEF